MKKDTKPSYTSSILSHTRKLSYELQRPLKRANSLKYRILTPTQMTIPSSLSTPSHTPLPSPVETKTHYVRKMLKRRIMRESPSMTSLASIPTSPNVSECESEDSDTSFFSNNSFDSNHHDTRNTTFNSSVESSPQSLRALKFTPFLPPELTTPLFYAPKKKQTSQVFEIPEILDLILHYVSVQQEIPSEPVMIRRAPLSRNHSLLIHGPEGDKVWESQQAETQTKTVPDLTIARKRSNLHNCLQVNKSWYHTTQTILHENLYFKETSQLLNFSQSSIMQNVQPYSLLLHKTKSTQSLVDKSFENVEGSRLKWIEFYITPNIVPPMHLITKSLEKLVVPGCHALTDDILIEISRRSPNLKHLDIRACDQITDASIYQVANNCPNLELFNCGRHKKGSLISDVSVGQLVINCKMLKTVGLAGCGISDWSIWELALNCTILERLSLNNCWKLTDVGLCRTLKSGLFDSVSVLEIRNLRLVDLKEIVNWRKRKLQNGSPVLIEACERIDAIMLNQST